MFAMYSVRGHSNDTRGIRLIKKICKTRSFFSQLSTVRACILWVGYQIHEKLVWKGMIFVCVLVCFVSWSYICRVVFHAKFVKGHDFWKSYIHRIVLPNFVLFFFRILCLKDPLNSTCLGVKFLHHYLLMVEKNDKYLLKVSNAITIGLFV